MASRTIVAIALKAGRIDCGGLISPAKRIALKFGAFLSTILSPVSLIAYVFAVWRLASDVGWTAPFAIRAGFFSHWLVWLSTGLVLSLCASILKRQPASSR